MSTPKTVLIVDDSSTIRRQVRITLEGAGYTIAEAENGRAAVDQIMANPQIAMAIADVNMPIMNGIDMLKNIQPQISAGLPVIMLTTEGDPNLVRQAKQAGAKGWMVKPFKEHQLIATVDKLTRWK